MRSSAEKARQVPNLAHQSRNIKQGEGLTRGYVSVYTRRLFGPIFKGADDQKQAKSSKIDYCYPEVQGLFSSVVNGM